jgi:lincosamide nucleotidyltransferase A/C/D/E
MTQDPGMSLAEALRVLDAIRATGCRFWLEVGWGFDALVGSQTRPHRDVDVDFDAAFEKPVLSCLKELGYWIETDWRPNRVELVAPGRGRVDLHPLLIDETGDARPAALDGGWDEFPSTWFAHGSLNGTQIPCVTAQAQRAFRTGYELRAVDHHDLGQLDRITG